MKKQAIFLLCLCLGVGLFFSCTEKDDDTNDQIVGAWQLTSKTIDGQEQSLNGQNEIILLDKTSVFKRYLTDEEKYRIGGWSMQSGILNISVDLPAAYYVEALDGAALSLKRLDFNADGSLKETMTTYRRVSEDVLP